MGDFASFLNIKSQPRDFHGWLKVLREYGLPRGASWLSEFVLAGLFLVVSVRPVQQELVLPRFQEHILLRLAYQFEPNNQWQLVRLKINHSHGCDDGPRKIIADREDIRELSYFCVVSQNQPPCGV